MSNKPAVVPIAQKHTNQCTITPEWFVDKSEYNVLPGKFKLLTNGEEAFGAVYDAIAGAQKSVSIICWGFQPSMYFKRGEKGHGKRIGELLEERGTAGVKVRVLSWAMEVAGMVDMTWISDEPNLSGRRKRSTIVDRPATMSDAAYDYNQEWFMRYDKDQSLVYDKGVRKLAGFDGKARTTNVELVSRGFSEADRAAILASEREDKKTSETTRAFQAGATSHHQKVVIVDFEDPERAVGFVMGHNTLDEYWDRSDHSCRRCDDPRLGRNGSRPREDFSSRIHGPMLGDLFHNFNSAWKKETGKDLTGGIPKPVFERYPLSAATRERQNEELHKQLDQARHTTKDEAAQAGAFFFDFNQGKTSAQKDYQAAKARQKASEAHEKELEQKLAAPQAQAQAVVQDGTAIMGQILRTQSQYGVRDIAKGYLQAVNNATQYIYIENQYFRWSPLAEKIKACAAGQTGWGRKPETHGPLYLFVITNVDKEGMGVGTVNTARMLESLGRADTLPEVSRQQRVEDTEAELAQAKQQSAEEQTIQRGLGSTFTRARSSTDRRRTQQQIDESKQKQAAADQRAAALKAKLDAQRKDQKDSRRAIAPEERPGLKVHIASLVAPDSPGRSGTTTTSEGENKRALTREERIEETQKRIDEKSKALAKASADLADLRMMQNQETMGRMQSPVPRPPDQALAARVNAAEAKRDALRKERDALKKERADLEDRGNTIDWVDVYVHAKLLIIDDTFMTLGSANINSRSMETDSELNIIHANHLISQPARKELWQLHTKARSGGEGMNKEGMKEAYESWKNVMNKNKDNRKLCKGPVASLVEFFSGTKDRSDMD